MPNKHKVSPLSPTAGQRTISASKAPQTPLASKGSGLLGIGMAAKAGASIRGRRKRVDEASDT